MASEHPAEGAVAATAPAAAPRYNIVTVVTFDYYPFLLVFLQSFFRHVDHARVERLYIVTDRFPDEFRDHLAQFEKVEVISEQSRLAFSGAHGADWRRAVGWKLLACQAILDKSPLPLVLLDSDTVFVGDIGHYVGGPQDVLVTHISDARERHVRRDGLKINFIASAVVFNRPEGSRRFIERWRTTMAQVQAQYAPPHETPALNLVLEAEMAAPTLAIGVMSDHHISADQALYPGTRVIHLKTWGPSTADAVDNFFSRISRRAWAPEHSPANYLDALAFERWLLVQRGYLREAPAAPGAAAELTVAAAA